MSRTRARSTSRSSSKPRGALATLPNLRLIASLWAGVDGLLADPAFRATFH
jgi:hypothetical protein